MTTATVRGAGDTRRRWLQAVTMSLFALVVLALLCTPVHAAESATGGQTAAQEEKPMAHGNPIANYWRAVRGGSEGITTESGPYTTNTLIQNGGQNWRQVRNGLIANFGGWLLGLMLAAIAVFFALRGRVRIEGGESGRRVPRFTLWQRIVHWYTALTVILLGLTGLVMLFGRALLIPLMGKDSFAAVAAASKWLHNYTGPLFVVAILMLIVTFAAGNMFRKGDLKWLADGGGMAKGRHASAGRYNPGEKGWFWLASIAGLLIAATGIVLDFPGYGQTREVMQWAETIHATAAVVLLAVAFGHIYIGTLGMQGAIDGMAKGHVDANWAKQHHDQWYQEMEKKGMVVRAEELEGSAGAARPEPGTPVK